MAALFRYWGARSAVAKANLAAQGNPSPAMQEPNLGLSGHCIMQGDGRESASFEEGPLASAEFGNRGDTRPE
jgi:hypothetical protein